MKQISILVLVTALTAFAACTSTNKLGSITTNEAKNSIQGWPQKSQEVATDMMTKYGPPAEVTGTMLVWHNNGPWKKTILHKEPIQHDFPMPHVDLLEQFINYSVPAGRFDDLARYDGSVVVARTAGEMSARCDKEGANFLALNLANDVVMGRKNVEEARSYYALAIKEMMQGKIDPYLKGLQFSPMSDTKFADQPAAGM